MKEGIGGFLWKLSVALYLVAIGVVAVANKSGDLGAIFSGIGLNDNIWVIVAGVIALVAGVAMLLEMFNVKVSFIDTLLLILTIIWVVFIVFILIAWIRASFGGFWEVLKVLAINLMICSSLLISSKKFG